MYVTPTTSLSQIRAEISRMKGQHAIAQFPIWKYTAGKKAEMSEEEAQSKGYCFMKVASFFKADQVERKEN